MSDITEPLIISLDRLKFFLSISDDVTAKGLTPLVIQSTDLSAQNILGTALTVKLRTDFNDGTLSGVYQELYNSDSCSVEKMVIYQTYVLGLPKMLYKIGAKTISRGDTDEITSIDNEDLSLLQRSAAASRVGYENRVKNFLIDNWKDIPELSDNTLSYLRPTTTESDTSQGLTYTTTNYYDDL